MEKTRFDTVIGTGGIGSGILFALEGNRTLGRNESRMARRLESRDYCKQHIILHYISVLARELPHPVAVLPVGAVGDDEPGHALLDEMTGAGMDVSHVRVLPNVPTLYCVAFTYPDGSGGNITESQSASAMVRPSDLECTAEVMRATHDRPLVLAAPEVPLDCRTRLLEIGRQHGSFNVASFVSEEIPVLRQRRELLGLLDLLAINIDEAVALAGTSPRVPSDVVAAECAAFLSAEQPGVSLAVTDGAGGSYCCQGGVVEHLPTIDVQVSATAGAGDAFLAGFVLGALGGFPFQGTGSCTSHRIARLLASMSVESPHTINFGVVPDTFRAFAATHGETALADGLFSSTGGDGGRCGQ